MRLHDRGIRATYTVVTNFALLALGMAAGPAQLLKVTLVLGCDFKAVGFGPRIAGSIVGIESDHGSR